MKTLKVSFIYLITVFTFVLISGCSKEENPAGGGDGGGGGGGGSDCQLVATSPGTWDITFNFAGGGDPIPLTGLAITQTGCTVTMSTSEGGTTVTITGPLSNSGVWTAALTTNTGYSAMFTGTFGGGPPYTTIGNITGTDSEGGTITSGSGAITL